MATALSMITRSMRLAGVFTKGEVPDEDEAADGLEALNTMLDSMSLERLFVYYIQEDALTLSASDGQYTVGPTGNLNITRPSKVDASTFVRLSGVDYPLQMLDQDQWAALPQKSVDGFPRAFFADMQYPLVYLNFYPRPSETMTCQLRHWKQLQQFAALTTELALPPGYKRMIEFNLAVEFGPEFSVDIPQWVAGIAQKSRAVIKGANLPTPIMRVETAMSPAGLSNIFTG